MSFERSFSRSFGNVRVSHDAVAASAARSVGAAALSVGDRIVFGADQYEPATARGRYLLAHELAHIARGDTRGGDIEVVRRTGPVNLPANAPLASPRQVFVDGAVFDQICRGNRAIAEAFLRLRASGARIYVTDQVLREMTVGSDDAAMNAAYVELLRELNVTTVPGAASGTLTQRVEIVFPALGVRGGMQPDDSVSVSQAVRMGAEWWSSDRYFRTQGAALRRQIPSLHLAPETSLPVVTEDRPWSYGLGRRLLGLAPRPIGVPRLRPTTILAPAVTPPSPIEPATLPPRLRPTTVPRPPITPPEPIEPVPLAGRTTAPPVGRPPSWAGAVRGTLAMGVLSLIASYLVGRLQGWVDTLRQQRDWERLQPQVDAALAQQGPSVVAIQRVGDTAFAVVQVDVVSNEQRLQNQDAPSAIGMFVEQYFALELVHVSVERAPRNIPPPLSGTRTPILFGGTMIHRRMTVSVEIPLTDPSVLGEMPGLDDAGWGMNSPAAGGDRF